MTVSELYFKLDGAVAAPMNILWNVVVNVTGRDEVEKEDVKEDGSIESQEFQGAEGVKEFFWQTMAKKNSFSQTVKPILSALE